ncbi:MAG: hypothetical protein OEY89_12070 [Gammaproteobacteria bacterium]|nr:hypothetical protein [Gammaproteobacteria bacterium]
MALPLKPTLGELRAEIMSRLGYGAQGAASGAMITTINSYLKRGQEYLYWKYNFNELRKIHDWTLNAGQTLYDWPDNMEPRQLIQLRVLVSSEWQPMTEGIEYQHDTVVDSRSYPCRYDRRAQLEIFPQPDISYTLRGEHYQRLNRFTQDGDRCTIDDTLLFNYALAKAKRHYKQDDAKDYFDEVADMLKKLKAAVHGNKRYIIGEKDSAPVSKPSVIDYQ